MSCVVIYRKMELCYWLVPGSVRNNRINYLNEKRSFILRLFSNRSQKTSKCGKNNSDTLGYCLVCNFFVLTTVYRHL